MKEIIEMIEIRPVHMKDKEFWYRLDKHLPESEFDKKFRDNSGYVLLQNEEPLGILRYQLLWDNVPFCTLVFVKPEQRGKGFGKMLMEYWEKNMKQRGFRFLLTSTRVDENAQHFYRKLGYRDCGGLVMDVPDDEQPMELFLRKVI